MDPMGDEELHSIYDMKEMSSAELLKKIAGLCPSKTGMLLSKSGFLAFLRANETHLGNKRCRPVIGSWLPGPKSASKVVVICGNQSHTRSTTGSDRFCYMLSWQLVEIQEFPAHQSNH